MSEQFKYDVFLSHSSKDKTAVRELAERLQADGLRVCGEHGLNRKRLIAVCGSSLL